MKNVFLVISDLLSLIIFDRGFTRFTVKDLPEKFNPMGLGSDNKMSSNCLSVSHRLVDQHRPKAERARFQVVS